MIDSAGLLAAYDSQLRTDAETPGALSVTRLGPLRLVTFAGGRGFITYQDLGGADEDSIRRMVPEALAHFQADPAIAKVEWKTRGHDHAPGLHEALLSHGFTPDEPESIMVGDAEALAVDVPLPDGEGHQPQRALPGHGERARGLGVGAKLAVVGRQQAGRINHADKIGRAHV